MNLFLEEPDHFVKSLYSSALGRLRIDSLIADLVPIVEDTASCRSILDLGCGHAPVTARLLAHFPHLSAQLVDPSEKLLLEAEKNLLEHGIQRERFSLRNSTIEDVVGLDFEPHALVLCHGVIGWSANPEETFESVAKIARRTGSVISLLVGQYSGHLASLAVNASFESVETICATEDQRFPSIHGTRGVFQFTLHQIQTLLHQTDCMMLEVRGVRVLSDFMISRESIPYERLWQVESQLRQNTELISLANMIHALVKPKSAD